MKNHENQSNKENDMKNIENQSNKETYLKNQENRSNKEKYMKIMKINLLNIFLFFALNF